VEECVGWRMGEEKAQVMGQMGAGSQLRVSLHLYLEPTTISFSLSFCCVLFFGFEAKVGVCGTWLANGLHLLDDRVYFQLRMRKFMHVVVCTMCASRRISDLIAASASAVIITIISIIMV
jgi:hypothetical protein